MEIFLEVADNSKKLPKSLAQCGTEEDKLTCFSVSEEDKLRHFPIIRRRICDNLLVAAKRMCRFATLPARQTLDAVPAEFCMKNRPALYQVLCPCMAMGDNMRTFSGWKSWREGCIATLSMCCKDGELQRNIGVPLWCVLFSFFFH